MKMSRSAWVIIGISAVMIAAVAYFGPSPGSRSTSMPTPVPVATLVQATTDGSDPYDKLMPYKNGPGVLVADPIVDAKVDKGTAALGFGCSR